MIAVLGAKMYAAGDTLEIEESGIDADFRPDEVAVTWREDESTVGSDRDRTTVRGAEATVSLGDTRVTKRRQPREYRHPALDERLRRERTRGEARLTSDARRAGVPTPLVWDVDVAETNIEFQRVGECDLRDALSPSRIATVARHLARLHRAGFVHGDPTTRNARVRRGAGETDGRVFLIDFGLGYHTHDAEDHAMDLHVFGQSLAGTSDEADRLRAVAENAYREVGEETVLEALDDIEGRGRYQ